MVEVALALLVISLGLSTVLTLFPAGLKATREAENANNLVEAAEYAFSYLQTLVNENGLAAINIAGEDTQTHSPSDVRIESVGTGTGTGTYIYHKPIELKQSSGYAEDFSCVIRILDAKKGMESTGGADYILSAPRVGSAEISCTDGDGREYHFEKMTSGGSDVSDIVKVVDVELSYPISAAYANRTKRTFRMVFLSNTFKPHE